MIDGPRFRNVCIKPRNVSAPSSVARLVCGMLCISCAAYGQPPDDRLKDVLAAKLEAEAKAENPTASVAARARAAAWEITFAETAVERGSDAALWSTALDEFEQGLQRFQMVDAELAASEDAERELSRDELAAMQTDAIRARTSAIAARVEIARAAERERLNRLREIAAAYRTALELSVESDVYDRIGDYERLRESTIRSLRSVAAIYDVAKSGQDPHLFVEEPIAVAGADFDAVRSAPEPLGIDVIAQLKALHALAAYRIAVEGAEVDAATLAEAKAWAQAAVDGTGDLGENVPPGHDADNVLALYVASLVDEASGVEITSVAPASAEAHARASADFARAKAGYDRVLNAVAALGPASESIAALGADVRERKALLEASLPFLQRADRATAAGRPEEALRVLKEGANIHRDAKLWASLLDAARRSGASAEGLLSLVDLVVSEGFAGGDSASQIAVAQAEISAAWSEISQLGLARMELADRERLRDRLIRRRVDLTAALSGENSPTAKAQLQAVSSLAAVYASMLDPDADRAESDLREALELAGDSAPVLEQAIAASHDMASTTEPREGLIAARLALGHLAIRLLPNYREDASLAFAAAVDEMGKLPYSGSVSAAVLGSPMFDALARRSEMAGYELADRERQARRLVERFLEGVYALQFGDPRDAADRLQTAITAQNVPEDPAGTSGFVDAAEELRRADGFDAEISLQESVHCFTALAEVRAGRPSAALRSALRAAGASTEATPRDESTIAEAVSNVRSPLVGFALASALEASAEESDLDDRAKQETLVRYARQALEQASKTLESSRIRSRYPQLESQIAAIKRRLDSDSSYVESASERFRQGEWDETSRLAGEGLRRHPSSQTLRQLLLDAEIERLDSAGADESEFRTTLDRVAAARRDGLLSDHQERFATGRLYESWGNFAASLDAYEAALATASEPADRIRTRSRLSELRLRSDVGQ